MKRKKILFIQNNSHLYPLDEKIKPFLSHIKNHFGTFVETLHIPGNRSRDLFIPGRLPIPVKGKLIWRAVKYDLVFVRNILDVNLLRGLRVANDNIILELSHPAGSALDLSEDRENGDKKRMRNMVEKAVKTAKTVFVDGDHQVNILKKWNNNISICPPVFPHDPETDLPGKTNDRVRTIGCAGTGEIQGALKSVEKGLQEISNSFPHIYAIANSDSFFSLDPPIRYVYKKIVPSKGEDMFADTDIFIFPARRQRDDFYGNSLFVLHALAARKPCIVWHTEIDRKIFEDGKDMFIVSSEDEFVDKLVTLIENNRVRATMAEQGYKKAQKYFSPKAVADFYIDAFRKMLETK